MNFSVKDAVTKRISVRTYKEKTLREEDRNKIEEFLKTIDNPFNIPIEFRFLDGKAEGLSSPVVVGTDLYVGAKAPKVKGVEEAFGYVFEQFVLYAASLGIGTVWIAGTMDRPAFEKAMEVGENEVMIAVTPIGYPSEKRSMRETMMRKAIKADERFPFEKMFFKGSFEQPLTEDASGKYKDMLEMVRLAPSAVNKQPWRVVLCDDTLHFYEKKTMSHGDGTDIQRVDIGIALAHFVLAAKEKGLEGQIVVADPQLRHDADTEYIVSLKMV